MNAKQKAQELMSEPRDYTDEEIQQFLIEFGYETGAVVKFEVVADLLKSTTKEKIFFFSSMILFVNSQLHNITIEQKDNYIKHLAYIVAELSKEI
ncbi:hypothetical protein ABZQ51_28570 [Pseudomonas aeruginosa]